MLREYIKFNSNILGAFIASFTTSAIVAQLLSDQEHHMNTTYTTATDYIAYFGVFSILFYLTNRRGYRLPSGKTDTPRLWSDLKKLVTSLGVSEIVYTIMRWGLQYYLLSNGYDPYVASMISHSLSALVYMVVINMSVKLTRLYGKK